VEVARYFPWDPQPIDEELLRAGREIELRYKLSWWDSMIVAAAQLQDCVLLLTEDLEDGAVFGAVTVRSPFTLGVREAAAHYTVEPSRRPAQRLRGRPRRWLPRGPSGPRPRSEPAAHAEFSRTSCTPAMKAGRKRLLALDQEF
jgi:hypothetical protein